ncbi:MAG: nicotinamide-nucleotide amidase [Verrucomicrobia bacterium]|jgi:nicotinamide-nucleotide amidase|nr:MAG: nicotinamide-nucleotide amidase [Verrucomicrobiota bacterium]
MRLELINTGTELLLGSTVNTHLSWLGQEMLPLGLRIGRQVCIPDGDVIREALRETAGRADVVLVTGGLGPTSDDITREVTAEWLGLPLEEDAGVKAWITAYMAERGRPLSEAAKRQAMVPRGAEVLANPAGTAPGLYVPPMAVPGTGMKSPHLFLLPGPPRELKPMVRDQVLPRLAAMVGPALGMRNFHLAGLGETQVAEAVEGVLTGMGIPEIGYCARAGEVIVRVFGTPEQLAAAEMLMAGTFPAQFFSSKDEELEQVVVGLLAKLGQWVSVAESCTGGLVAHRLTNVPGASAVVDRTFVTYANRAKSEVLGVPAELIAACGAVSRETAAAMAVGCLAASGADHALALTGIAGPGGGTEAKPVGTVFVALASKGGGEPVVGQHLFRVERETFKRMASQAALDLLRRRLIRMI